MHQVLVLLAALAMPLVAWASQRGVFGPDNGTISDRYPTLLVADGYAFSIWGVIFLLDLVAAAWLLRGRPVPDREGHRDSHRCHWLVVAGFALTASWMIVSRVTPGRIDIESGGVTTVPSLMTKMFSPGPSAT